MDLERLNFLHAADVTARSSGTVVRYLFSKPGLVFIIWLFFHLQHINNPKVREARRLEHEQAKLEHGIEYCFKKQVRIAARNDTPLAKDVKEACKQEILAKLEKQKAHQKRNAEIQGQQRLKEAEIIAESER